MKSCNKKCLGCGAILNHNKNMNGYVDIKLENPKYCLRCFKLIHYSQIDNSNINDNDIKKSIELIDLNQSLHIFCVVDILNLDNTILDNYINYQHKITFIVNKMDLLPQKYNSQLTYDLIVKTFESYGYKNPHIIFSSTHNISSIKKLYKLIVDVNKKKQKAIFVGCSNVGKSSLINKIFKINNLEQTLTVSPYINTTILLRKLVINKNIIIDTPGINQSNNILNYLSLNDIKKISNIKKISPINFFINPLQSIKIDNLISIDYLDGVKSTFTFYMSNELKIQRIKTSNIENHWLNNTKQSLISYDVLNPIFNETIIELDEHKKHNLLVSGLGLISLNKGIKKIKIKTIDKINIKVSNYAII